MENKSKLPIILGVLVLIAVVFAGGIFIGYRVSKGDSSKVQSEQKEVTFSDEANEQIDFFIRRTKSTYRNITSEELSVNEKLYLAYESLLEDNYKNGEPPYNYKFSKKEV